MKIIIYLLLLVTLSGGIIFYLEKRPPRHVREVVCEMRDQGFAVTTLHSNGQWVAVCERQQWPYKAVMTWPKEWRRIKICPHQ